MPQKIGADGHPFSYMVCCPADWLGYWRPSADEDVPRHTEVTRARHACKWARGAQNLASRAWTSASCSLAKVQLHDGERGQHHPRKWRLGERRHDLRGHRWLPEDRSDPRSPSGVGRDSHNGWISFSGPVRATLRLPRPHSSTPSVTLAGASESRVRDHPTVRRAFRSGSSPRRLLVSKTTGRRCG